MARLSLTQRLIRRAVSGPRFAAIEAQSRRWHLVCPSCGWRRSCWDAGGVRYKAVTRGKRTLGRCPGCGAWVGFRTEWIDDDGSC